MREFLLDTRTGETSNIIEEYPEEADRFRQLIEEYLATPIFWSEPAERLEIDEIELNQLRALGYQIP